MAIIGIDLGTTNSLVSVWQDGKCRLIPNAFGEFLTPSVVSLDDNGELLVGRPAKERLISHPERTVSNFKQFMGTKMSYTLADRLFYPEDLSSFILRQLKDDAVAFLGEEVTEAVISVPAYFNDQQRSATKNAGKLAGLKVDRIINEPSAAALAHQCEDEEDGTYLVFDFGGGTLDISVVEMFANIVDIVSVAGNNHLGGTDIDNMIVDKFLNENKKLYPKITDKDRASIQKVAEQCKMALTDTQSQIMVFQKDGESYAMGLDNKILTKICQPLLIKIKETLETALKNAGIPIAAITDIILVGGSCRMPLVRQYITYITGKKPLSDIDPSQSVAIGVGTVAGIKSRDSDIRDMILTDVCPFTLGIAVQPTGGPAVFSPIINKNSSLPISIERPYFNARDGQTEVNVEIYQGESIHLNKDLLLGNLEMQVPPMPAGELPVNIRFTYDINGILEVDVSSPLMEKTAHKLIVSNQNLSDEEVERRVKELSMLKISPREKAENRQIIAQGERLFEECAGIVRERVAMLLNDFQAALDSGENPVRIEKRRKAIGAYFDQIDEYNSGLLDLPEYGESYWEED